MTENPRGAMFRVIAPDRPSRVTNAELFFDLVFVYDDGIADRRRDLGVVLAQIESGSVGAPSCRRPAPAATNDYSPAYSAVSA
ncbi:MAG TPA: hypothetical protein VGH62_04070 [Bradyrhizobium sp.]|jgi:hypothetical protein